MTAQKKKPLPAKWLVPIKLTGKSLMQVLFEKMIVMYPASAQTFFITDDRVKIWCEHWAETFERKGIIPADIKRGLLECENHPEKFMPSLPQFLAYCKEPFVQPMHRTFQQIEHRLTDEERKQGLHRLKIVKDQLFNKSD